MKDNVENCVSYGENTTVLTIISKLWYITFVRIMYQQNYGLNVGYLMEPY